MKLPLLISLVGLVTVTTAALGNDTMAQLGAGGLIFIQAEGVKMLSEDLHVSTEQVRVRYEFRNEGPEDHSSLVAFPMPDITGSPDFMVAVPTENPENLFGFVTTFNGEAVDAELHQYAFSNNIEYTDLLAELGVPLMPFGQATVQAINTLPEADVQKLLSLGLVVPLEYDAGEGWTKEYHPVWTLRSAYSWNAEFKRGETATVEHRYRPSVGGTVAVTFLSAPYEDHDPAAEYKTKYCTDPSFIKAVEATLTDPQERYSAPYTESWLSYIWSTGNNWNGPIGKFHLTIDKGREENLVSFCWDGEVKKTSPTTFEMEATDWFPPYNRELEILILNRNDVPDNVG
jgi:hypothetical protein